MWKAHISPPSSRLQKQGSMRLASLSEGAKEEEKVRSVLVLNSERNRLISRSISARFTSTARPLDHIQILMLSSQTKTISAMVPAHRIIFSFFISLYCAMRIGFPHVSHDGNVSRRMIYHISGIAFTLAYLALLNESL